MTTDYSIVEEALSPDCQVVVIKRYDDNGGMYSWVVTRWPNITDESGRENTRRGNFLTSRDQFVADLETNGFVSFEWSYLGEDFARYITYNLLPVEWHSVMGRLGDRVVIWTKTPELLTEPDLE